MIDQMYYDMFEDSYVLEQDLGAPPERYILLFRGTNGMYVESWIVNDNKNLCMDIAFNEDAMPAHEFDERVNKYVKN